MRPRVTEEIDKVREKKPMHWVVSLIDRLASWRFSCPFQKTHSFPQLDAFTR
jgi:hypothetical protein